LAEAATQRAEPDSKRAQTVIEAKPLPFPGKELLSAENPPVKVTSPSKHSQKVLQLVKHLKEFNEEEEGRRFDASVFPCNVCFAEKLGSQSIRFPGN